MRSNHELLLVKRSFFSGLVVVDLYDFETALYFYQITGVLLYPNGLMVIATVLICPILTNTQSSRLAAFNWLYARVYYKDTCNAQEYSFY
jgi:hypothetical protein